MIETVAIIAPGAMGSAVGARLAENGMRVLTSLAGRSAASAERARQAGMVAAESDAQIAGCDVILSIVPPGEAVALAQRLAPAMTAVDRKPVYVDCNAVNPATMARIGEVLAGTGCALVDGGIIGPPPKAGGRSTRIYLSGPEATRVAELGRHGLDTPVLDGPVGAASALKMSYAGITKGFSALGAAMMLAAARGGSAGDLKREMAISQPHLLAWLSRQVPGMYSKAYRWVAEMEEIAGFAGEPGAPLYEAAARFYDSVAADYASDKTLTGLMSEFCADG